MADINSRVQPTWRAICERDRQKLKLFYGNFSVIDNYSVSNLGGNINSETTSQIFIVTKLLS